MQGSFVLQCIPENRTECGMRGLLSLSAALTIQRLQLARDGGDGGGEEGLALGRRVTSGYSRGAKVDRVEKIEIRRRQEISYGLPL